MRHLPLMLLMLVAACATATPAVSPRSGDAFCDAILPDVDRHSVALVDEASDAAVLTGQHVIAKIDAFCGVK